MGIKDMKTDHKQQMYQKLDRHESISFDDLGILWVWGSGGPELGSLEASFNSAQISGIFTTMITC